MNILDLGCCFGITDKEYKIYAMITYGAQKV